MLSTLLRQTAEVLVETFALDAFGEEVASVAVESTGLPCLVRPMSGELLASQGREASARMSRIYFDEPPFPAADARQRLVRVDGQTYRPVDSHDQNSMGRLWQVDCELVTG